jgi:hypothetical protein
MLTSSRTALFIGAFFGPNFSGLWGWVGVDVVKVVKWSGGEVVGCCIVVLFYL